MILLKSPLRISLGGGGTDLESFYRIEDGYLVAGAINKFIYIAIHENFSDEIILKYSKFEKNTSLENIKHPIFREALRLYCPNKNNLEITSFADIPSGTGLGSSSTFTNALILGLNKLNGINLDSEQLAQASCNLEINVLNEPIGKQDQYISSYGGIREFTFKKDGKVEQKLVYENLCDAEELEENLVLVFTGKTRSASKILKDQKEKSENTDIEMIENLKKTKKIGLLSKKLLLNKEYKEYGKLMHEHWLNKKKRSAGMSNKLIDDIYEYGLNNGANGGKVIGAGGGGFILFQSDAGQDLKSKFRDKKLNVIDFSFTKNGTEIISA